MKVEPVVESYDKVVRDIQSNLVVVGSGERISGNGTPVVVTNKPTTKFIFRIPAEGDTPLVAS